jgi:hypothetical protein
LANVVTRTEAQTLGAKVATGLVQRTTARLLREWLLPKTAAPALNQYALVSKQSLIS